MPATKRNKYFSVRVTESELSQIELNKMQSGYNQLAKYIRDLALNDKDLSLSITPVSDRVIPKEVRYELNRIGVNLNQISKRINQAFSIYEHYLSSSNDEKKEPIDLEVFKIYSDSIADIQIDIKTLCQFLSGNNENDS